MRAIELCADDLRLVVLPEVGGGIARFELARSQGVAPLFRPWDGARADPNTLGCYVLCPFSNRVSGGGIEAGNRFWPLAANLAGEPYPIHGDAWQRTWTVEESSKSAIGLRPRKQLDAAVRLSCAAPLRARRACPSRPPDGPASGRGRGPLRPGLPPMAAAHARDHAASRLRSRLARAAGPPAGSMLCRSAERPRLGLPVAAAAAPLLGQQRLRRLAASSADPLAGAWARARDRGKRGARDLHPVLAGRRRRFLLLRAGLARGRRRSICRAGPKRMA